LGYPKNHIWPLQGFHFFYQMRQHLGIAIDLVTQAPSREHCVDMQSSSSALSYREPSESRQASVCIVKSNNFLMRRGDVPPSPLVLIDKNRL
jgi:hypothetical protein